MQGEPGAAHFYIYTTDIGDNLLARVPICDQAVGHLERLALLRLLARLLIGRGTKSGSATCGPRDNRRAEMKRRTALTAASEPYSLRSSKVMMSPQTNVFSKSVLHATITITEGQAIFSTLFSLLERREKNVLDDTGGLWCEGAVPDGPRADLVRTAGEVVDELHVQNVRSGHDSNLLGSSRDLAGEKRKAVLR